MAEKETLPLLLKARGKYLVPNAITAANMILGLISVFYASKGFHATAAWIIGYCIILDKLDGSTARMLKASSEFGIQFDSFSDFVSFGIAPAYLVYSLFTIEPWSSAFEKSHESFFLYFSVLFFILMSATRLARFNVTTVPKTPFFFGLPTPGGAGFVMTFVLGCLKYDDVEFFRQLLTAAPYLLVIVGFLEITSFAMLKVGQRTGVGGKLFEVGGFIFLIYCFVTRSLPEVLFVMGVIFLLKTLYYNYRHRDEIQARLKAAGVEVETEED